MSIKAFTLLASLLITACATTPQDIEKNKPASVAVLQVQQDQTLHIGKSVSWGGSVLSVANQKESTLIEILSRPLDSRTRPTEKAGKGRFMVEMPGFVDPASYPVGREVTATGTLIRVEKKLVGEFSYPYPVIGNASLKLWPERREMNHHYPYYYDPFFGPPSRHWPYATPFWRPYPYYW